MENLDGYPLIAAFQSSSPNFQVYRKFTQLHCRVLLALQYELQALERDLDQLDHSDAISDDRDRIMRLHCWERDLAESSRDLVAGLYPTRIKMTRPEIIEKIRITLLRYGR